jgi:phosphatidylserine/phosphatidylglycerophosphate/cardiolipin synthase-like enzyme
MDALKQAQAGGAQVRVLIEQNPYGGGNAARATHDQLKAAGLDVKYASPGFKFTHEKSAVIDGEALIFTANATRSSVSRNREFGAALDDPADVAEIATAFEADWNRAPFEPRSLDLIWSPANSRDRLTEFIRSAQTSIEVYAASAQDDGLIQTLAEAGQRGVRVRMLSSPARGEDAEDGNADGLNQLQRGGVDVRLLKSPYVHAKVFIVDGARAFLGSQNISATSLNLNRELGVIFSDPAAVKRISATFQTDWNKANER